jgi:23S rRNA (cytosine1962-C5)-methyltransferase
VLELLTEGTERWRAGLEAAARDVFAPERLVVRETGSKRDRGSRGSARRDALTPALSRGERGQTALSRGERGQTAPSRGEKTRELATFAENGLRFFADVSSGQKTGFYLDQRENRSRLKALARGQTVLNLFSYSGGFSVAALAGGAIRAVDVDSSAEALALAREHRKENGLAAAEADFAAADVFEDLRRRAEAGETWDIVVLDPPAFAKKRSDVDRAARGYKDVNRLAMKLVAPGGWLLTCSCSGLVSPDLFQKILFSAGLESGRIFSIAARQGAGPDHPVSLDCPEGEYLKGLWLAARS